MSTNTTTNTTNTRVLTTSSTNKRLRATAPAPSTDSNSKASASGSNKTQHKKPRRAETKEEDEEETEDEEELHIDGAGGGVKDNRVRDLSEPVFASGGPAYRVWLQWSPNKSKKMQVLLMPLVKRAHERLIHKAVTDKLGNESFVLYNNHGYDMPFGPVISWLGWKSGDSANPRTTATRAVDESMGYEMKLKFCSHGVVKCNKPHGPNSPVVNGKQRVTCEKWLAAPACMIKWIQEKTLDTYWKPTDTHRERMPLLIDFVNMLVGRDETDMNRIGVVTVHDDYTVTHRSANQADVDAMRRPAYTMPLDKLRKYIEDGLVLLAGIPNGQFNGMQFNKIDIATIRNTQRPEATTDAITAAAADGVLHAATPVEITMAPISQSSPQPPAPEAIINPITPVEVAAPAPQQTTQERFMDSLVHSIQTRVYNPFDVVMPPMAIQQQIQMPTLSQHSLTYQAIQMPMLLPHPSPSPITITPTAYKDIPMPPLTPLLPGTTNFTYNTNNSPPMPAYTPFHPYMDNMDL